MREKRKEKLKEEAKEAEELLQAPLDVFGKDIMLKILKSLNERSMTLSLLVSRAWNSIACSDMLWTSKLYCEKLWFGKAHIPRLSLIPGLPKLAAYSWSVMDCKRLSASPISLLIRSLFIYTCARAFTNYFVLHFYDSGRLISLKKTFVIIFGSFILTRYVILVWCLLYIIKRVW
ncbi:F-box domain-containing protein [Citrus sinensis]|uniref:F-box domain-containing protein n=1 Tax=Citrus sinensis TaxID=2711 RepID=A0ACB8I2P1_CITSI|nr:F-box domain-containing protein [Citrus sinensis]